MLRTYFNIAWRSIKKHKVVSFINIFGLASAMVAFWLIALYVLDEWSFDRYNKKADRIFRVAQHGKWNGGNFDFAVTPPPFADALKNDFPQIEDVVRINPEAGGKIRIENKQLDVPEMLFADNSLFNIFSYKFLYGSSSKALIDPQAIVLTKTLATAAFGDPAKAINQSLIVDKELYIVSAVLEDVPLQSHFSFKALRAYPKNEMDWRNANSFTYVLLRPSAEAKEIEGSSKIFFEKYLKSTLGEIKYNLTLQPLTDIHLRSKLSFEIGNNGNITYVYAFVFAATLILLVAIFNYVNLSTAISSKRVKEIGTRKVIGAERSHLTGMFFMESILYTLIAAAFTALILYFVLPSFNNFTGKNLSMVRYGMFTPFLTLFVTSVLIGCISAIYPAVFIAGFRTLPSLKGLLGNSQRTIFFRKSLVIFQFAITVIMIVASLVVYRQLKFVANKDLGFNKDRTLTFHINNRATRKNIGALKQALLTNPLIESVGVAGNPIGNNNIGGGDFNLGPDGKTDANTKIVQYLDIDEDFVPTLQIKVKEGRNFSMDRPSDKVGAILVNEALVKELGWGNVLGKTVVAGADEKGNIIKQTIIGVVKDFNTYSLQHKIAPTVFALPTKIEDNDNLYIRLKGDDIHTALAFIKSIYSQFDDENLPDFRFLDKNFAAQYQTEEKQGSMLLLFTILTISIACLGLFGLATFASEQRTKEIGIRKVLGASVVNIAGMLTKDFLNLIGIAFLIAVPIAWIVMKNWLTDFAYHVELSWWIFAIAGFFIALVAVLTISFRGIKAALTNPVDSLRAE